MASLRCQSLEEDENDWIEEISSAEGSAERLRRRLPHAGQCAAWVKSSSASKGWASPLKSSDQAAGWGQRSGLDWNWAGLWPGLAGLVRSEMAESGTPGFGLASSELPGASSKGRPLIRSSNARARSGWEVGGTLSCGAPCFGESGLGMSVMSFSLFNVNWGGFHFDEQRHGPEGLVNSLSFRGLNGLRKKAKVLGGLMQTHPSAAKAAVIPLALSARLKSCPFKTAASMEFFRKL
jgi:hypothetical protein